MTDTTQSARTQTDEDAVVATDALGPATPADEGLPGTQPAGWIDRLVELHILADHGCAASAEQARRWLATDDDARRTWDEVERVRNQIAADTDTTSTA